MVQEEAQTEQKEEAKMKVIDILEIVQQNQQLLQDQISTLEKAHTDLGRIVSVMSQALDDKGIVGPDDYQVAFDKMSKRAEMLQRWKEDGVTREEAQAKLEEIGDNPKWVELAYGGPDGVAEETATDENDDV